MPLREAIDVYHDLLSPQVAADTAGQLDDQLRRRGLFFGDRALCSVMRPRFLLPESYRALQYRTQGLVHAFDTAFAAAIADPAFRAQFGLSDWEEELVRTDPGFREPSPVSRVDAFLTPDEDLYQVIEYNAETPAGQAYGDALSDSFFGTAAIGAFLRRYDVRPLPARPALLHALLDAYQQFAGRSERPRIAILDWGEVPTYSEFVLFDRFFAEQGLQCVIADPRHVEYRGGKLYAGDFHINLIYKRVLISELVERGGLDHPVVRAVRDGAVCMVNPFRCKVLHKKASLAVLSDERNAHLFTREQCELIERHVPWTRRVEERHTVCGGREVDLIPFVAEHRDRFVLKPNDEYGGEGVVLGWTVDSSTWEAALKTALAEPSVVQERVSIPTEPYPSLIDGELRVIDRMLDTDPFVLGGGCVDGCLSRLSTAALLNVTAGGGSSVPTFLIEKRN